MASRSDGVLAQVFQLAMEQWDREKAAGVSKADRVAHLTMTLRASWPFTREWKFVCTACEDRGLVMADCVGDATCGRTKPHLPHDYGTPCWCPTGARFRDKPKPSVEDYGDAAKVRQPSRIGRR